MDPMNIKSFYVSGDEHQIIRCAAEHLGMTATGFMTAELWVTKGVGSVSAEIKMNIDTSRGAYHEGFKRRHQVRLRYNNEVVQFLDRSAKKEDCTRVQLIRAIVLTASKTIIRKNKLKVPHAKEAA